MTVVVADSSPLNYLTLIGSIGVLQQLYGRILVPRQVVEELTDPAAPHEVRNWARTLPEWVDVRSIPPSDDPALSHLDPGEQSAIVLAQSEAGALLLIDDAAGRLEASRRGIQNTGTLGVIRAACLFYARRGLTRTPKRPAPARPSSVTTPGGLTVGARKARLCLTQLMVATAVTPVMSVTER